MLALKRIQADGRQEWHKHSSCTWVSRMEKDHRKTKQTEDAAPVRKNNAVSREIDSQTYFQLKDFSSLLGLNE